jgi:hypothetical protein
MDLQVLREHKLYTKINKYNYYQKEIHYLVHILEKGLFVDLEKVVAIVNWSTPKNVIDVILFMGLVVYY